MGGLFSYSTSNEEDTLKTSDLAPNLDETMMGGSIVNSLNNNILNILKSEFESSKYGGMNIENDINKNILNILNSVNEINSETNINMKGGEDKYVKYDIFNIIRNIEEGKKGGAKKVNDTSDIDFSNSSDTDIKQKITNAMKGGANEDVNDDIVEEILKEELKQTGGDCSCKNKNQLGGRYESSSSSSYTDDSSSSYTGSSSESSSDSSSESLYKYNDSESSEHKKSKKSTKSKKVSKPSKSGKKITKKSSKKISKKSKTKYGGDSTSNNTEENKSVNMGNGVSIFPFNSSSVMESSASEKNFRLLRRHI